MRRRRRRGAEKLRNYESVPRPFVLEPPLEARTDYAPGETLQAGLVLCGRAIAFFPYFVVAFREMGERGIGRGRGRFEVARVTAEALPPGGGLPSGAASPAVGIAGHVLVYDGASGAVRAADPTLTGAQVIGRALAAWGVATGDAATEESGTGAGEEVGAASGGALGVGAGGSGPVRFRLRFETPTRLKFEERLQDRPEFHVVVRNLLRRLSSLAYFHHGFELDLDFRGIIGRAAVVRLLADRTEWLDWERYSSRQDRRMRMGGLVGEALYEAPDRSAFLAEFLPLLALGEYTHVGKNVTFGLGRFRVRPGG